MTEYSIGRKIIYVIMSVVSICMMYMSLVIFQICEWMSERRYKKNDDDKNK